MLTYKISLEPEYPNCPGSMAVFKDDDYHDTVSFFWDNYTGYNFYDKDRTFKIGYGRPKHCFKTFDEAISAAKAMFDPFDFAIEKINKHIDQEIDSAQHHMHLRIAEFRGNLFTQIQSLRS